jgi:hypothetical protein
MKSTTSEGRGKKGVRDAIILILSTGFCFGAVVAFILNAIIPIDHDEPDETVHMHHYALAATPVAPAAAKEAVEEAKTV